VIKRSLLVLHRWLGVALCLFFLIWFPSGIGMMYWDFPGVTADDRLERSPALDRSSIQLSPAEALAALRERRPPDQIRLDTFDGRPVYRIRMGREERVVYADTGATHDNVSKELMARVASAWTGQPASAAAITPIDVDQWTVQGSIRSLRPLWKYSWPDGEQVYVSQGSGEVVQYTTRASRIGAYFGPIPHWLYFTPLRKHQLGWTRVVIWSSGIGTGAAILGIIIGVWMYSPAKRYRFALSASSIPYRGQKRWHMVLGLIFGVGAVTWAFSGMLSMDPFPSARARRGDAGGLSQALRGGVPVAALAANPQDALARLAGEHVKELELTSFDGKPTYIGTMGRGRTRIVTFDGRVRTEFDRDQIARIVTNAAGPAGLAELRELAEYDWYYLDRRRTRPLPVILVRTHDAEQTRYYIDPRTARIVGTYSSRNWISRWLYHGLHSLDVPWLYNHRPAWDIVVITFMLGGSALGVTSLILAWRVVGRTLSRTSDERQLT
jgi:PepSY-associated TM region